MRKTMVVLVMLASVLVIPAGLGFGQDYSFEDVESDMEALAQSISDLIGPNIGSMTFLGDPVGFSTVPHFSVGVGGGAVLVPLDAVKSSNLDLNLGDLAYTPIPAIGANGRANIKGFELGVKVAGIPSIKVEGARINSLILGGKVRYRLLDKKMVLVRLGASVGAFYEYTTGSLAFTDSDTMTVYADADGDGQEDDHVADLTTEAGLETSWSGSTVGAEAQGNVKILFFNIFAGGRLSKSFGSADTTTSGSTTLEDADDTDGFTVEDDTQEVTVSTSAIPGDLDTMVFGGVEFKILPINIVARGSYNFKNENLTADLGARLQF
ncbi:MAG: hypothetical protein ACOC8N_04915 [Spirochaetota bacterium]